MEQLAFKLASGLRPPAVERTGATRDQFYIVGTLHAGGFVWKYGRPLGSSDVPELDRVVDLTIERLEDSPYRTGRNPMPRDEVVRAVRRNYFDVASWPFDALIS